MTEEEKPVTREDVLKMIEEHGGPEGLDLSERNLEGIDLSSEKMKAQLELNGMAFSYRVEAQLELLNGTTFSYGAKPPLDLHGIILEGANLKEAWLTKANLQEADLQGADLSDANLQGANLWGANLQQAYLSDANLQGAKLWGANLQQAYLSGAQLQEADLEGSTLQKAKLPSANLQGARLIDANLQGVDLIDANLQEVDLRYANLQGADLRRANLSKAILAGVQISQEIRLEDVDWGPKYILGDEDDKSFKSAEDVYRTLKQWHTQAGVYDIAGEFYFREMTVRRKAMKWRPNPLPRAWSKFLAVLCGYGEKPLRVVASAAVAIFSLAGIYSASALSFPSSLYHSVVSFTALGYGLGASSVDGWVKAVGAAEAFMGVFMMALFLITFVRKMTR